MRFFQWYTQIYRVRPFSAAFVTCYLKGSIADAVTQTKLENGANSNVNIKQNFNDTHSRHVQSQHEKISGCEASNLSSRIDWVRNWRFSMFSGLYCGCVHHLVYNLLYSALFPSLTWTSAIVKTVFDSLVHIPFSYFPAYYAMKSMFLGKSPIDGLKTYWYKEKWTVLTAYWKAWIPVLVLLFYFVPYELRVGAIAVLSLFWLILLSYMSPMIDDQTEDSKQINQLQVQGDNLEKM